MLFIVLFCRGNFEVQWYHHQNSLHAVFELLCEMAQKMLTKVVVSSRNAKNTIFPRILWSMQFICL